MHEYMGINPTLKLLSNGIVIVSLVPMMGHGGLVDNSEVLSLVMRMDVLSIEMVCMLTSMLSSGGPITHLFCDRPIYTYGRHSKWSVVVMHCQSDWNCAKDQGCRCWCCAM